MIEEEQRWNFIIDPPAQVASSFSSSRARSLFFPAYFHSNSRVDEPASFAVRSNFRARENDDKLINTRHDRQSLCLSPFRCFGSLTHLGKRIIHSNKRELSSSSSSSIPSCPQVARASGSCLFVKYFSCSSGFAWKGEGEKEGRNKARRRRIAAGSSENARCLCPSGVINFGFH